MLIVPPPVPGPLAAVFCRAYRDQRHLHLSQRRRYTAQSPAAQAAGVRKTAHRPLSRWSFGIRVCPSIRSILREAGPRNSRTVLAEACRRTKHHHATAFSFPTRTAHVHALRSAANVARCAKPRRHGHAEASSCAAARQRSHGARVRNGTELPRPMVFRLRDLHRSNHGTRLPRAVRKNMRIVAAGESGSLRAP
jgi:hypothetical protein